MSLLRYVVTVVVALPCFLAVGWPHPVYLTFLVALVSFAAGYGVEAVAKRLRSACGKDGSRESE
jgi:hypothetical protein